MVLPHDEAGSGPAVLLLHAGIADRRMWAEHLEPLAAAGFRVVAVDLPGFGDAPPQPGAAEWVAVAATMDALGIDRAALVGNSFGAAVALRVAAVSPEKVSALALFGCPPEELEPSTDLGRAWEREELALERGDIDGAVEAVLDAWVLDDAPAAQRELVAAMQRRAFELKAGADEAEPALDPVEEDPALLGRIAVPVLVAAGERDMPDFVAGAEWLEHAITGARRVLVPDAGHLVPLDRPEAFRELVLELLRGQQ